MSLGNRYSQHSFAKVPSVNMARSKFDRSFAVKDTFDFDNLVPIFVDEVLPGDTINLNVKSFIRLAPQVRPIMDNMYIDYFFFFVPNRLVWDNFQKFMGEQANPGDSTDYLVPKLLNPVGNIPFGSIYDHMGLPAGQAWGQFNALPFRGYNLIWNEWFRDQNLQPSLSVPKGDGPDPVTYGLVNRAKKHDYFTSAQPNPQKGPAILMPAQNTTVQVQSNGNQTTYLPMSGLGGDRGLVAQPGNQLAYNGLAYGSDQQMKFGTQTGLQVDSTQLMGTINQLREAMQMQSLLELNQRGGTRYTEILKAHFGVTSPDARLQRPEFLSSSSTTINQHPIAQTSNTVEESPQGNLAAFSTATTSGSRVGFSKSFVEHGFVIGLAQARADITYQQGVNKLWLRSTKWDYFWPKLQEIGEQAVLREEIYYTGNNEEDKTVFGYQERYAEYRYKPSEIRGQFRSNFAQSLDVWHLAEEFAVVPNLNAGFITSNTPIERALIVPDAAYPHLLADFWFDYKHARPIVTYAVPASLGRF